MHRVWVLCAINKKNNKPRAKSELTFIKKLAFFYKKPTPLI